MNSYQASNNFFHFLPYAFHLRNISKISPIPLRLGFWLPVSLAHSLPSVAE
jgi:hypothetical protein